MSKFEFCYLTQQFYLDYSRQNYGEVLRKQDRPYMMLKITIDGITFALPFRTKLDHENGFITKTIVDESTREEKHSGIDYSKAIVLSGSKYIDKKRNAKVDEEEFENLRGQDFEIHRQFKQYIKKYKKAVKKPHFRENVNLLKYSTLQYFHTELGI